MSRPFEELVEKVKNFEMKKVSVAVAQDSAVIEAVRAAKDRKIADAILVGDEDKIKAVAKEISVDISDFKIIDVKDDIQASL
ncbi:MAG: phosphate butyryltransferase, partial [Lachnospiraceae bacterium]|nr:phosphate butyryltransferase [Lachnospiraceae bacterium]